MAPEADPAASEADPPASLSETTTDPAGLSRQIYVAVGISCATVFVCVFAALAATGSAPSSSFGIAVFVAFWGGGGVGAMVGGVRFALRDEEPSR